MKIFVVLVAATLMARMESGSVDNFDNSPIGSAPTGWSATLTGGNAKWTVEKDDTAPSKPNVLKQSGVATFPICFKNDTFKDAGKVGVWTKADSTTLFDDFTYGSK